DWYKNLIYAPGRQTGYAAKTLPGVREAIEEERWADVDRYAALTGAALDAYANKLDEGVRLMGGAGSVAQGGWHAPDRRSGRSPVSLRSIAAAVGRAFLGRALFGPRNIGDQIGGPARCVESRAAAFQEARSEIGIAAAGDIAVLCANGALV